MQDQESATACGFVITLDSNQEKATLCHWGRIPSRFALCDIRFAQEAPMLDEFRDDRGRSYQLLIASGGSRR